MQVPSQKGIAKQLLLGQNAELHRQRNVAKRNIQSRKVIENVKVGFGQFDLLPARDPHRSETKLQHDPGPEPGERVLDAPAAVEYIGQQRNCAEHSGDEKYRRRYQQVRAQTAQPMPECGSSFRHADFLQSAMPSSRSASPTM